MIKTLAELNTDLGLEAIEKFASSNLETVRSKTGFMMGIIRRVGDPLRSSPLRSFLCHSLCHFVPATGIFSQAILAKTRTIRHLGSCDTHHHLSLQHVSVDAKQHERVTLLTGFAEEPCLSRLYDSESF